MTSGVTPQELVGSLLSTPIEDALRKLVDERINNAWRGRTASTFDNVPDAVLCMELLSRGWVVHKPAQPGVSPDAVG